MMMCHLWARNGSVALNEIFFWKNHNFYVLLGLFNGAKFKKKVLRADPELSLFIFFGPKMAHLPLTRIFSKKPLVQFSITSWCLSLRRFWNNLEWIQSYDSIIFELKCPNCPEWEFFWKDYQNNFDIPLGLYDCAKFKKFLEADQWPCYDVSFLGSKWTICLKTKSHLPEDLPFARRPGHLPEDSFKKNH